MLNRVSDSVYKCVVYVVHNTKKVKAIIYEICLYMYVLAYSE